MKAGFILLSAAAAKVYASRAAVGPWGTGCLVSSEDPARSETGRLINGEPRRRQNLPGNITVDVNFHIASTVEDENLITQEIVDAQWKVLHDTYAKHDIHLVLNSTQRVVDDLTGNFFLIYEGPENGWVFYEEERNEYLKSTRLGGYDAMNLYFYSKYSPGASGYCQWPTAIAEGDDLTFGLDSCHMNANTMPGFPVDAGASEYANLGHTTVHEAGHWFGLNHTFVGGCSEQGDFVADTPAQRTEIYDCPIGSDSCPDMPGLDPIHNFMGYNADNWYAHLFFASLDERSLKNTLTIVYQALTNSRPGNESACLMYSSTTGGTSRTTMLLRRMTTCA